MYVTIHIYIYRIHATIHICKQTWLLMGSERNTTISCLPDESHPYQLDLFGVKPRKGPGPFWKRILGKHLTDDWKSTTCFSCCNLDPPPKWCQEKDPLRNLFFECFWDFFAYKLCWIHCYHRSFQHLCWTQNLLMIGGGMRNFERWPVGVAQSHWMSFFLAREDSANGSLLVWVGARWFGFLGFPYERDCYVEPQTTNPNQQLATSWKSEM